MNTKMVQPRFGVSAAILALVLHCGTLCWGAKERILTNFSPYASGAAPRSTLVSDANGNLYGTTSGGGAYGTVFMLSPQQGGPWKETVLHSFLGQPQTGPDGAYPWAGVVFGPGGALYGTTSAGGTYGCGTVFRLTRVSLGQWKEQILYSFACSPTDGADPQGSPLFDVSGTLYGTTYEGGNGPCGGYYSNYGCGTVFALAPAKDGSWTENVLYSFQAGSDGCDPTSTLTADSSGNLYGMAQYSDCYYGYGGTAFELSPSSSGWNLNTLYTFTGGNDGGEPNGGLVFDSASNLYGTTKAGGSNDKYGGGGGTVFELSSSGTGWAEAVLYSFGSGSGGYAPVAGVVFDSSGNLYGTTQYGGTSSGCNNSGCGTAFELSPGSGGWTESVIYNFTGGPDGAMPLGDLLFDGSGNLDLTAAAGGDRVHDRGRGRNRAP